MTKFSEEQQKKLSQFKQTVEQEFQRYNAWPDLFSLTMKRSPIAAHGKKVDTDILNLVEKERIRLEQSNSSENPAATAGKKFAHELGRKMKSGNPGEAAKYYSSTLKKVAAPITKPIQIGVSTAVGAAVGTVGGAAAGGSFAGNSVLKHSANKASIAARNRHVNLRQRHRDERIKTMKKKGIGLPEDSTNNPPDDLMKQRKWEDPYQALYKSLPRRTRKEVRQEVDRKMSLPRKINKAKNIVSEAGVIGKTIVAGTAGAIAGGAAGGTVGALTLPTLGIASVAYSAARKSKSNSLNFPQEINDRTHKFRLRNKQRIITAKNAFTGSAFINYPDKLLGRANLMDDIRSPEKKEKRIIRWGPEHSVVKPPNTNDPSYVHPSRRMFGELRSSDRSNRGRLMDNIKFRGKRTRQILSQNHTTEAIGRSNR